MERRKAVLGAATLGGALLLAGVGATAYAEADSGRTFCYYGDASLNGPGQTALHRWAVVDGSQDAACPNVDKDKFYAATKVVFTSARPESKPIPKIACTDLPRVIGWNPFGEGVDMCTRTTDDHVYVFTAPEQPGATTPAPEYKDLGNVAAYR